MNPFDTLREGLHKSAQEALETLPHALKPSYDIAKLYAYSEQKLEVERLKKAIEKRKNKGVSWTQLSDLRAKIERVILTPLTQQKNVAELEKELADLTQNEVDEDDILAAKEMLDVAQKKLIIAEEERDNYLHLAKNAGVNLGDLTNG